MTWVNARDQIAAIIEATTPTTFAGGLPQTFVHFKEADRENGPDSRTFWLEFQRLSMVAPVTVHLPQRVRVPIDVVVIYRDIIDPTALHEAIAADWLAICKRLLTQANWDQPTSTIESLTLGSGQMAEAEIERDERGVALVIHLTAEFTE